MIKLLSVSKMFGKGNNRVHALKNISLNLPSYGLIAIVGESGCGKTTLLNCIGGTDDAKGKIIVDNQTLGKVSGKNDCFRRTKIGYIYQDYALIEDKSVKYNLQLAVDVAKTSGDDDDKRILNVLEKVGMKKYLKRKVHTLSGGQKQRIAIARAIINSPIILLADEPTGHLDNANSHAIIRILQRLSKEILVIWVSHEENLVHHYANRIITMHGGCIVSDDENIHYACKTKNVVCEECEDIYLDEYEESKIAIHNFSIDIYTDKSIEENFKIIISNKKFYIALPNEYAVQTISYNALKEKREKCEMQNEYLLEPIFLSKVKYTGKRRREKGFHVIREKKDFISAMCFVFVGILVAFSMAFNSLETQNNYDDYLQFHKNTVQIDISHNIMDKEITEIMNLKGVKEILPYNDIFIFELEDENFLQTSIKGDSTPIIQTSVLEYKYANEIIMGRTPTSAYEVLIDEKVLISLLEQTDLPDSVALLGYTNINNFLNAKLKLLNSNMSFTIVGITKSSSSSIYISEIMMSSLALRHCISDNLDIYPDSLFPKLEKLSENEIYVNEKLYLDMGYEINDIFKIAGYDYIIKGSFVSDKETEIIMSTSQMQKMIDIKFMKQTEKMLIISECPQDTVIDLQSKGYNANSLLDITMQIVDYEQKSEKTAKRISAIITLFAAAFIYYMTEKSVIAYARAEIRVKRILGANRWNLFFEEVCRCFLSASIVGMPMYLCTGLVIKNISITMQKLLSINIISPINFLFGIILIYGIVIICTFLTYMEFLKFTPADLLKRK